jgi:hypothetical protein
MERTAVLFLALVLSAAAPGMAAGGDVSVLTQSTSKSMDEFSQCFVAVQERQRRPLWIVANEGGGGRISNAGATGVSNPYAIRFVESSARNEVQLFLARADAGEEQMVVQAVRSCS